MTRTLDELVTSEWMEQSSETLTSPASVSATQQPESMQVVFKYLLILDVSHRYFSSPLLPPIST